MKLLKNKKGQTDNDGSEMFVAGSKIHYYWLLLILLIPAFIIFILLTKGYVGSLENQPQTLVPDLVIARITNTCFTTQNTETGDPQQNIIDLEKFTEEQLRQCFVDWKMPRIVITLESLDNSFTNKQVFTQKGGLKTIEKRYTLVKTEDEEIHPTIITIAQE